MGKSDTDMAEKRVRISATCYEINGRRYYTESPPQSEPVKRRDGSFDYTKMTIGDRIRHLRQLRELDQTVLAQRAGVSQAAVSNIENNLLTPGTDAVTDARGRVLVEAGDKRMLRKPRGETLLAIARELSTTPEWLSEGTGDPHKAVVRSISSPAERCRQLFDAMTPAQQKSVLVVMESMMA